MTTAFVRPPTAQEAVLAEIRRLIVSGELAPGAPVRQEAVAERLGVSRVPVREALKVLEGEGHVVYAAHRGYVVAELSVDDLTEVYRLRELLEAALSADGATSWHSALTAAGVPCGPINDIAGAFELATSLALEPVVQVPGSPVPQVANPLRMSATPPTYRIPPAPLPSSP